MCQNALSFLVSVHLGEEQGRGPWGEGSSSVNRFGQDKNPQCSLPAPTRKLFQGQPPLPPFFLFNLVFVSKALVFFLKKSISTG